MLDRNPWCLGMEVRMEINKNRFHSYSRNEEPERFNAETAALPGPLDLEGCDLCIQDLRKSNLRTANLRNAYLKLAHPGGADLSEAQMDGASTHRSHLSEVFFPRNRPAQEILLPIEHGSRMRVVR